MDGVFMRKLIKWAGILTVFLMVLGYADLQVDVNRLQEDLIRLHVVAASDSEEDQQNKLMVRDAVVAYLEPILANFSDKEQAQAYLQEHLSELTTLVNNVLSSLQTGQQGTVTLQEEEFNTRDYDTFSLPAGVYDSLRIEIGKAEGKNWWCVAFPSLCLPKTEEAFCATATSAGFDSALSSTLTRQSGYEVRFFLLDCLGRLGNLFHKN